MEHKILEETNTGLKIIVKCSCGSSWSHPLSRTKEQREEIFESHKAYFNRPTTQIL